MDDTESKNLQIPAEVIDRLSKLIQEGQFSQAIDLAIVSVEQFPVDFVGWHFLAIAQRSVGNADQAHFSLSKVTELNPHFAPGFNNFGISLDEQGEFERAIDSYSRALSLNPEYTEAYFNKANTLMKLGDTDGAIINYRQSLTLQADYVEAHNNLGNALREKGNLDEATASYQKALSLKPNYAEAHNNMGNVLREKGRVNEALISYRKALLLDPHYAEAHNNFGISLDEQGEFERAIDSYSRALSLNPEYTEAYFNKANTLMKLGDTDGAIINYRQSLTLQADYVEAHNNLGNALREKGNLDEATASYQKALSLKPNYAEAHNNLGVVFERRRVFDEAKKSITKAISLKPNYSQAHANLGAVLQSQGEFEAAISSYNTAIALSPDYAEAILNKALLLLLRGDYPQGWLLYESRLQCDDVTHRLYKFSGQSWRGESSVARKKLLVYSEQGLGDVVQFCRYVPMLLIGDAEIIFEVQAPLYSLMETLDTRIKLIKKGSELPEVDFHCPVLSLPLVFNTTLDNVPATDAYLKSDPVKVSSWLRRLGTKSLPRIGIVWSGSPIHKNDHNRSIPLHELMPLFQITCEWHSLQKEYRAADLSALAGSAEVKQHQKYLSDFSETAALIECMDLVITVDTSVAHVAGALGKPVWILLAGVPDYRWLLDQQESPWYPSATLFRQRKDGCWGSVVEDVINEIEHKFFYETR